MTGLKDYLFERMEKGTIHMTLLDPDPAKMSPAQAAEIAVKLKEAGTDAFMLGGSTGVTSENLGATAKAVKEATGLPTIYFPSSPKAISPEVDGMFFMSILNSTDPLYISHGHAMVAPYVAKMHIETIPMAYIIIEPGMTVARVTKTACIPREDIDKAVGFALAAEYLGHQLIYLEAGSGADKPVPPEMIRAVKQAIHVPLIIGGGIRTPEAAKAAREAGADAIVTGTFVEQCSDEDVLTAVVHAAKGI
jgi:phosphoglycerol geranylgeranyltransferase